MTAAEQVKAAQAAGAQTAHERGPISDPAIRSRVVALLRGGAR